jgi:hypothetical protein
MTDERRKKIIEDAVQSTRGISNRADEVTTKSTRDGAHIQYRVERKRSTTRSTQNGD